jgi:phosphoglycerol transferase MdoB-like AlkP superfamily enzyme
VAFASTAVARAGTVDSIEAAKRYGLVGWTVGSAFTNPDAEGLAGGDEAIGDEIAGGSVTSTTVTATGTIETTRAMTPQENIDALIGVVASRTVDAPAPGAAKGMNVIVIQWEALQTAIVGRQMAGKPVTPTLDKLIAESYYFPGMISQAGQGVTADTEFVTATGLLPPKGKPAAVMASDRKLTGLVRTLGGSGWQTVTMHANYAKFWNRTMLYPAIGWQRYYDRDYFGADDVLGMGESDAGFFTKALPLIRKYDDAKKPAYIELITLSSHHPFNQLPTSLHPLPLTRAAKGTLAGRYAQSQNYTDREVGDFLTKLDKEGILDRSVLIIYGDHFGLSDGSAKEIRGRTEVVGDYQPIDRLKVPLIIHLPKQTVGVRSDMLISQADLPATVADLVGVPLTRSRLFGASAFLQRRDPVIPTTSRLPLGSFAFDGGVFRPGMGLDGAVVWGLGGAERSVEASDRARFARATELNRLSDAAVGRLPKIKGTNGIDENAKLPPAAERAIEGR